MCRSFTKLSLILITLMVIAGGAGCQAVSAKKRDLSSSSYYIIKKGDTLYSVGLRAGHGYKRLAKWNNIPPPYKIYQGQTLKLFSETPSSMAISLRTGIMAFADGTVKVQS